MINEWTECLMNIEKLAELQSTKRRLNREEAMLLTSLRFKLSTKGVLLFENLKRLGEYGNVGSGTSGN